MGKYIYYIIAIAVAAVTFGVYFLLNKKAKKAIPWVHKIIAYVIFVLMFVWLLLAFEGGKIYSSSGKLLQIIRLSEVHRLTERTPFAFQENPIFGVKGSTVIALLSFWAYIILHVIGLVSPFFNFKVIKRLELFFAPVLALFCLITLPILVYGLGLSFEFRVFALLMAIELGLLIGKLIYIWIFERIDLKMNKSDIVEFVLCFLGSILFTMPEFMPNAFLGSPSAVGGVVDFGTFHRYYIYMTFIFLIGMTLLLRNRKGEYSRMVLMFICFGGLISFSTGYTFDIFTKPYDWPFHICNTAMFILPIALCTKSEKIFYFTFFVNILGAMLATFMPVYDATKHFLSTRVVEFFTNHIEAMAVPLVCVLTGVFPRPKARQFFYSMCGFAVYYIIALVLNTVFTAQGHKDIDFFFINSTFVAEKIHAEKVFTNFSLPFTIKGTKYVVYPLYQTLYFIGFIALSIGMWYVYLYIFKFQDFLIGLNERSKKMKLDAIALKVKCNQKEVSKCMNEESKGKLIISHFGKRYTSKAPFAVRDINFEAKEGEIIGFLGPNGAGKSTTIKAIVGIHLPTEGKIEVNGYDVEIQPVQAKAQIGFVPDHYALYENLTGREYLNYIADLYDVTTKDRDAFMNEYLETLNMKEAIDSKIQTYSHGMKQKIAIMASIIHNPKIWILDEPLTGLDPVSIFQVKQCLKRHAENGNIVFFSSHLIDIVEKLCDRIIIISGHKVVDVADVKALTKKGVNLEQYYMDKTGLATGN